MTYPRIPPPRIIEADAVEQQGHVSLGILRQVVRVSWDGSDASVALSDLYPYHRLSSHPRPHVAYLALGTRPGISSAWSVYENDRLLTSDCPTPRLVSTLERWITMWVMERQTGVVLLHAAAVASRAGTLILAGPSGAGKTTMTLALRKHGLRPLGDDVLLLNPDELTVCAFPRSFLIKGRHVTNGKALSRAGQPTRLAVFPDVHGGANSGRYLPVSRILFLEREAKVAAALLPCAETEALRRLLELSSCRQAGTKSGFRALARLVRQADCCSFRYADADRAAAALVQALDEEHAGPLTSEGNPSCRG